MFGLIFFSLLSRSLAEVSSDELKISVSADSDKITAIILKCGTERFKQTIQGGEVLFQGLPEGVCNLKFNPSGETYRNVAVGAEIECTVSSGRNARCVSTQEKIETENELKNRGPIINRRAETIVEEKRADDGQIVIEILPTSERVLSINLSCGEYRKRMDVEKGKVVFSEIPEKQCNLKFNPGGGSMRNIAVGSLLQCMVHNGNRVSCS